MSAITQASAQVAKTVAVTTGKVSNAKSMMIWRPHGNKYVETKRARERDEMKIKVGEGLAISRNPSRGCAYRERAIGRGLTSREEVM